MEPAPSQSVAAFLGRSAVTRAVATKIQQAVSADVPVLLVGAPGTGKRTIAELIHHFGDGQAPSLQTVKIDESGRLGHISDLAYLCPVERLSLEQQVRIPNEAGLRRLLVGTRLDPDSREGRARLSSRLVRWCRLRIQLPTLSERIEDLEGLVRGYRLTHKILQAPSLAPYRKRELWTAGIGSDEAIRQILR